jgi:tetratricopeptide (TPR) repeat protein
MKSPLPLSLSILFFSGLTSVSAADVVGGYKIGVYDKRSVDQSPTPCDRATAYTHDRDAVARPVAREDIDLDRAIASCISALDADPNNPRLHYQLGRVYGYKGEMAKAMEHRKAAAEGGYPIAVFVVGYVKLYGDPSLRDPCGAAALIERSAAIGAYAGLVGYPAYTFAGLFEGCGLKPAKATFQAYLMQAKRQAKGQFENLLVESLTREAARMPD